MNILLLIVLVGTAAVIIGSLAYTLRWFNVDAEPAADADHAHQGAGHAHAAISPHDPATTQLLKRFFGGKDCAICKRPIPPVQWTGRKPGLYDPATGETHSWDEIPNEDVATVLENQLPLCSACAIAESFRQHHADLVIDREETLHGTHGHQRMPTES